jgi:hypothetical protein
MTSYYSPPGQKNPFEILNVAPSATLEEINAAYRQLARMYHPDKLAGLAPELRELAEQHMKSINSAYDLLKRGAYAPQPISSAGTAYEPEPYAASRPAPRSNRDLVSSLALWGIWLFACLFCSSLLMTVLYILRLVSLPGK